MVSDQDCLGRILAAALKLLAERFQGCYRACALLRGQLRYTGIAPQT